MKEHRLPKFKKGDLVKYIAGYNNYGDCQATRTWRLVMSCVKGVHDDYVCWDGKTDPYWYELYPEGHHWCDPEHGLELVSRNEER